MSNKKKIKGLEYDHASIYPNTKTLSSSQVLLVLDDPEKFFMEYKMGQRREESNVMSIGSVFSCAYTDRKVNWRKLLEERNAKPKRIYQEFDEALKMLPVVPKRYCEYPMTCNYKGWKFRATLDGYYPKNNVAIENKTGSKQWVYGELTKSEELYKESVDTSGQITFQNWVNWKKNKKPFDYTQLHWVDFRPQNQKEQLVQTLKTKRTVEQLQEFQLLVDQAIKNVEVVNTWI